MSASVFLAAVVAAILGIGVGAAGLATLGNKLSPDAATVVSQQDGKTFEPQHYGNR
jgi:hypothetical protein